MIERKTAKFACSLNYQILAANWQPMLSMGIPRTTLLRDLVADFEKTIIDLDPPTEEQIEEQMALGYHLDDTAD